MCGIVGYVGPQAALDVVVEGLRRLEYRGYDSAGVAMVAENTIHLAKKAGKISNLEKLLAENPLPRAGLGLGHTRWATHGAPNDVNAHPHVSAGGRVAVVHNGISENFVASDVAAFIAHTREAIELGQDQVVEISAAEIMITNFDGSPASVRPYHVDWDLAAAEKGGYDWFMRKEIYEQPKAVADTLLGRHDAHGNLTLDEIRIGEAELRAVDKIVVVACGTAFYAGLVAKYAIEHWTRIPCEVELASEFRYRDPIVGPGTLVVAISQSGETADTLMAIRHAREQRARVLAICNTNGSTIPRESDAVIYTHAGPEVGVASTKGFLTQLVACYLLGLYLAQVRGTKFRDEIAATMRELATMPAAIGTVLDGIESVLTLAADFADEPSVLFLGRHVGYPVALEGALKLKELAYIHAEGFAAGELKHGP